ncbi:unnamed protein product [Bemisia tabaci]|uniref:Uncharacterized protein n=1 Tax=Bemisia tabaci TaxID=7038 RepID=A0A9P0AJJ7_BEMTA|nr:unnamed protein product [Bemisia tabaci]
MVPEIVSALLPRLVKQCSSQMTGLGCESFEFDSVCLVYVLHTGDAILRELTSNYDKCGKPLANLYPGVTSRKGFVHTETIFDNVEHHTRPDNKDYSLIVSMDIKGWSPEADREAWARHHDYVVHTCKAPDFLKMRRVWKGICAVVCKRGFIAIHPLLKGLFQGWTGLLDTLLNVRAVLYSIRIAREKENLANNEAAYVASLIDDTVLATQYDSSLGIDHAQDAASAQMNITAQT